jgi:hypothetical protein
MADTGCLLHWSRDVRALALNDIDYASRRASVRIGLRLVGDSPTSPAPDHDAPLHLPRGYDRFLMSGAESYLRWLRITTRDPRDEQTSSPFAVTSPLFGD